jgi:catechol 2,3-dioxygenase-like lactoylglutathione lyase family enzyme
MTHINGVHTVGVPVTDQDRALEFYVGTLGFEKRMDGSFGEGLRWIEVAPPGATTTIALVPAGEGAPAGVDTGWRLATRTPTTRACVRVASTPTRRSCGSASTCRRCSRSATRTATGSTLSRWPDLGTNRAKGRCPMEWKLEVVVIPVTDVDRAKTFYHEQVGFAVDHDTEVGHMRFVQLTPNGSGCSIVIGKGVGDAPPGSAQGTQLVVPDIDAARAELVQRGVAVSPVQHFEGADKVDGRGGDWNSFVFFSDPDGNSWTVQERPAGS